MSTDGKTAGLWTSDMAMGELRICESIMNGGWMNRENGDASGDTEEEGRYIFGGVEDVMAQLSTTGGGVCGG